MIAEVDIQNQSGLDESEVDAFLNEHENKDLLRFLTCGSVDDGKSTLIGRLLYDSKLIFDDQLKNLHDDSERVGNAGEGEIDYALLLDGLKAEREQGITIDVAYRYFSTPKRKFIIADTPGHEQYTRNMATGASTADLAVILIDARRGVLTQTRRHSFIVSLLGIRHVVVAVNKMDLVDYSQERFEEIRKEFSAFADRLGFPDVQFVPLSALRGDNVVERSDALSWYDGAPVLEILESVDVHQDRNLQDFRFPVQTVLRPDLNFRGFAGTVASGTIAVGDSVAALPSGKQSTVKRIVTADGDLDDAFVGQAIALELADEIDISGGEMIVKSDNRPMVGQAFEATLVWMSEKPLNLAGSYVLKHTTRKTRARVSELAYGIDVNTLKKDRKENLELNEIGRAIVSTTHPLFFDAYAANHVGGSFILIDEVTNTTVAAGMIVKRVDAGRIDASDRNRDALKEHIKQREVSWTKGSVSSLERQARNGHKGKAVILAGPSGNGKHDLAKEVERTLFGKKLQAYYMGIENIFEGLDSDMGRDYVSRDDHLRHLGELARIITEAGLIFITAIDHLDDYELEMLKLLNSPYDLVVINLGESEFLNHTPDLQLPANPSSKSAVQEIFTLLGDKEVIMDYVI